MDISNATSIDIIFENCEWSQKFLINDEDRNLIKVYLTDVSSNIVMSFGDLSTHNFCKKCEIILHPRANIHYDSFGSQSELPLFDRILRHNDIVAIGFNHNEKFLDEVFVPWKGESDYENSAQINKLEEDGCLHIIIE